MSRKFILIAFAVLALVSMACSLTINLPVTDIKTGPTQTEDIQVPSLDNPDTVALVTLSFGAGDLKVAPGAENALITGTATYNVADFKPKVTTNGDRIRVETGNLELNGFPRFGSNYKNSWDLKLADTPMELTINAGAYHGNLELGGLSLKNLTVGDGAAEVNLTFSQPNKTEMDTLRYETGASSVTLSGLANADLDTLIFKSGAGDYTLDFSGDLKRDATVTIDSGMSSVTLIVPSGTSARVFFDGGLTNVDLSGDWEKSGSDYTQAGSGPTLTINVNMGAGNLNLRNR